MDVTTPEELAKFAEDVRQQHVKFVDAATEAFRQIIAVEYGRLRSIAFESGRTSVELNVSVRCNFDPANRRVQLESTPVPSAPRPRTRSVDVE
jgi:hypothetical protein